MATLAQNQLELYLSSTSSDLASHRDGPSLAALSGLIKHHVATFPFESLSLHYSPSRKLSLRPDDIYTKMVGTGRGGYCMEQNALFAAVLRTMGYQLFSAGARVSYATAGIPEDKFMGW
jgi:arylamine N-acetyltransferase